jgi:uncharacterized protein
MTEGTLSPLHREPGLAGVALVGLIKAYQRAVSPALPVLLGPACGCRFYPSCSAYAVQAVETHGTLRGSWLAATRLMKCTPLHPGGLDPVPLRRTNP